LIWSNLQTWSY